MVPGGYTGEGYTGVLPSHCKAEVLDSEAGPGRPRGPGVGGLGLQRARATLTTHSSLPEASGARFAVRVPLPGQ